MTPIERRLFKEQIIKEYKLKHELPQKKNHTYNEIVGRLKKIIPINIGAGVIASVLLVYINGWEMLGYLMLSGVIWLTLISSLVSAFLKPKK